MTGANVSESWSALTDHPLLRQAHHIAHAVSMIGEITERFKQPSDDPLVDVCMKEALLVNIRLLADFLVKRTTESDFGPADFIVSWNVPPAAARLDEHWHVASQHVVHLSKQRTPERSDDLAQITTEKLERMATDALDVFGYFLDQLPTHSDTARAEIPDPSSQEFDRKALHDATELLREELRVASERIGMPPVDRH